ncbi:MAG: alanine racemase [Chloroflexi bacterium]|nr:alanine racemase [Chloroflexota bacterium]
MFSRQGPAIGPGQEPSPAEHRPNWLDVDLDAVGANVRAIRALVGPAVRVCAVVKADAYGLGAVDVGWTAIQAGADRLAVARVEEGISLRAAGIRAPILLLCGFAPSEADEIVRHRITPTVVRLEDVRVLAVSAARARATLPVHVKVDTGLTRFGAHPTQALALVHLLSTVGTLRVEGLYTHFASADEPGDSFTGQQLGVLREVLEVLEGAGQRPPLVHAANSAATLGQPDAWLDMVRIGVALSGHYPSDAVPQSAPLRPAVSLRARLLHVQDAEPGTTVGYGRTFTVERPMRLGLVPAGYADGVPRSHSNHASALLRSQRVRLVGRVSMDQCMVDVTDVPGAAAGDEVTLFGTDGRERLALEEYAAWSDTIVHEVLCRVGVRVPRRYQANGQVWWRDADSADGALAVS